MGLQSLVLFDSNFMGYQFNKLAMKLSSEYSQMITSINLFFASIFCILLRVENYSRLEYFAYPISSNYQGKNAGFRCAKIESNLKKSVL